MRDTLIIGLLLAMPVAVILASASLALLVSKVRRRLHPLALEPNREAATLRRGIHGLPDEFHVAPPCPLTATGRVPGASYWAIHG